MIINSTEKDFYNIVNYICENYEELSKKDTHF